ncbi:MAG: RagB/SusD family nutrient uptake outer membrane protein [Ginsengibacter sp.]
MKNNKITYRGNNSAMGKIIPFISFSMVDFRKKRATSIEFSLNKILKYILPVLIFSMALSACGKKFLEEKSRSITIADLLKSNDGAERLTAAVYSKLYAYGEHSFSWIGVTSITSDDADKGSDPGDQGTDKGDLDNWTFSPSAISFSELWLNNYEGIGRATYALKFLPETNSPDKDRYMGEAKFLRAYFYFNLVRIFGGVPLIDKVLESESEIASASTRATSAEIYAFIEKDLTEAILTLPATIPTAENGRVTQYAAQAMLAKVYLYEKKWAQAKGAVDIVINSNQFALMPDYALIWREVGEFSKESIWEVNCIGTTPNLGIENYFVTQAPRGDNGLGWGFNTPSQNLLDAYEPGDVRKAATIMFAGETLWDGFQVSTKATNPMYNYKSYVSKTKETFDGDDINTNKNLRILRYGEILLIKAEVENELGNVDAAKSALNQIRARAQLTPSTAATQVDMRNAIYKERRVEMAFEHDRTFDLMRTGRAGQVLRALGKKYIDGKNDLFPIPQGEINLSDGKLIQNPGY